MPINDLCTDVIFQYVFEINNVNSECKRYSLWMRMWMWWVNLLKRWGEEKMYKSKFIHMKILFMLSSMMKGIVREWFSHTGKAAALLFLNVLFYYLFKILPLLKNYLTFKFKKIFIQNTKNWCNFLILVNHYIYFLISSEIFCSFERNLILGTWR